jgi:hypothetical protein
VDLREADLARIRHRLKEFDTTIGIFESRVNTAQTMVDATKTYRDRYIELNGDGDADHLRG